MVLHLLISNVRGIFTKHQQAGTTALRLSSKLKIKAMTNEETLMLKECKFARI